MAKAKPKTRSKDDEIYALAVTVFGTPSGQAILQHLKSITINRVFDGDVSNDVLRHMEGQRFIVGLLEAFITQGHKVKSNG